MEMLMTLSSGIAIVNVALLIVLFTIYARIYKSTRAVFTVGLMFFASMLMLHNITAVYAYFAMELLYASQLLPYFLVVHLAELVGIAVPLKVTL